MKVNLFIAGFAKCGSSYIYSLLSNQEGISGGCEKEPASFTTFYDKITDFKHDDHEEDRYLVDGTVEYAMIDEAADRIYQYNSAAKIIFVIRDPVSRAWSHYWHRIKMGEEIRTLEDLRKSDLSDDYLVSYGKFRDIINNWLKIFGTDQVIIFTLDQINSNRSKVCERLEFFLHKKINYYPDHVDQNSSKIPRFLWLARFGANVRKKKIVAWPIPAPFKVMLRKINRWIQNENLIVAKNPKPPFWWRGKFEKYLEEEIIYYEKMMAKENDAN